MFLLRSRAGDPAAQLWYSDCGDGTSPFPSSGNEGNIHNQDVPFHSVTTSQVGDRRIGISSKAPQELPPPAPCVGLLILPVRQTIGPGSTQRMSTTAVPRATKISFVSGFRFRSLNRFRALALTLGGENRLHLTSHADARPYFCSLKRVLQFSWLSNL